MTTFKNIELRIYLIGQNSVGKRSFAKKFEKLNSTETIHGKKIQTTITDDQLKKLKRKEEHKYRTLDEAKEIELLKLRQQESTNFTKIFTLGKISFECKVFIPSLPVPLSYSDAKDIVDDLDETEHAHKLKFEFIRQEIKNYLQMENYNFFSSLSTKTINFFVFMYDLSSKESLHKAIIYFEGLNKTFKLTNENNYAAFIGNKIDIKFVPKEKTKNSLDKVNILENNEPMEKMIKNLLDKNPKLSHYEISCKVFYSFEKLFEKFLCETLVEADPAFKSEAFIHKLNELLNLKGTFCKSDRQNPLEKSNLTPGPQQYNTDIYNVGANDLTDLFSNDKKYSSKIFVNKSGPIFGAHTSQAIKKNEMSEENLLEDIQQKINREKIVEQLNVNKVGYSMGISPGKLDLFNQRNSMKKEVSEDINVALSLNNVTRIIKKSRRIKTGSPKIERYTSPSNDRFLDNKEKVDSETNDKLKGVYEHIYEKWRRIDNLKRRKEDYYSILENERQQKREAMRQAVDDNLRRLSIENQERRENILEQVNVSKSPQSKNKGFSIVGKPKTGLFKTDVNHNYYTIKSEFDCLVEKSMENDYPVCKFKYHISIPQDNRFKNKLVRYFDKSLGKYINIEESKVNAIKNRLLNELEEKSEDRITRKEDALKKEAQIRQDKRNKLEFIRATSSNQLDENTLNIEGPSVWSYQPDCYIWGQENQRYSIAGKLQNNNKNKDRYDDNSPLLGLQQSIKLLANSITNRISNPNVDSVKESSPKFSFPKSDNRFIDIQNTSSENPNLGPGSFYHPDLITINRNKNKIF